MSRHTGTYRRRHLVDRDTAVGWHQFQPLDSDGPLWWCSSCHTVVALEAGEDPGRCPDFLRPIEVRTSPPHDPPAPAVLQQLSLGV